MRLVLDASLVVSWFFKDQRVPKSVPALRYVKENGGLVPPLWSVEIANVLVKFERRRALAEERTAKIVEYLRGLPIAVDVGGDAPSFSSISYARAYGLSAYDAAYLDVAVRFGLKIASLDAQLESAAASLDLLWQPSGRSRSRGKVPLRPR